MHVGRSQAARARAGPVLPELHHDGVGDGRRDPAAGPCPPARRTRTVRQVPPAERRQGRGHPKHESLTCSQAPPQVWPGGWHFAPLSFGPLDELQDPNGPPQKRQGGRSARSKQPGVSRCRCSALPHREPGQPARPVCRRQALGAEGSDPERSPGLPARTRPGTAGRTLGPTGSHRHMPGLPARRHPQLRCSIREPPIVKSIARQIIASTPASLYRQSASPTVTPTRHARHRTLREAEAVLVAAARLDPNAPAAGRSGVVGIRPADGGTRTARRKAERPAGTGREVSRDQREAQRDQRGGAARGGSAGQRAQAGWRCLSHHPHAVGRPVKRL